MTTLSEGKKKLYKTLVAKGFGKTFGFYTDKGFAAPPSEPINGYVMDPSSGEWKIYAEVPGG